MAAALVEAAEQIAETEGAAAVSVRRVADEVGTTTRAVYSVFGSKDGLLVALAARGFELLGAEVAALPVTDDPVDDLVRAGAEVFRQFSAAHPALFRISFQRDALPAGLAAQFDEARRTALAHLVERLDRLAAAGGIARHTPSQAALHFHSLCEGLAAAESRGSIPAAVADKVWREGLYALLIGLGQSAGSSPKPSAPRRRGSKRSTVSTRPDRAT